MRQSNHPSAGGPADPKSEDTLQIHTYPFATLPKITSHLHPKFAMFALGYHLHTARCESRGIAHKQWPVLRKVRAVYCRWLAPPPSEALLDPTYVDPNVGLSGGVTGTDGVNNDECDSESEGDSVSTRPRRIPYSQHKRRRRVDTTCLSPPQANVEAPMLEDQDGDSRWTHDAILEWAQSCSPPTSTNAKNYQVAQLE
jgi:hypothetical protein